MTIREVSAEDQRNSFYDLISKDNLFPLWQRFHTLALKSPVTKAVPAHWDYDGVVRPHIFTAGNLVTAEEA